MNGQQALELKQDVLDGLLRRHQETAVGGVTLTIDKGNLHGGIYILVGGLPAMYVSKTNGEHPARLRFSGPQQLYVYREKPIAENFPDIYQTLNQGQPVTRDILDRLSVLRGRR